MVDFDFNSLVDRAQSFDSFVQLKSGADRYRYKSLEGISPVFNFPNLDRIADDGTLFLTPQVSQNKVTLDLVLTADQVDTVHPPTNVRTVSYFLYQKNLRNSVQVSVSTVYFAKDASTNKFLRLDFTFELEDVGVPRLNADGDSLLKIGGRLLPTNMTFQRGAS